MLVFPVETVWLPELAQNIPPFLFVKKKKKEKNEINKTWHLTIANIGFIPTYHLQTKVTATERVGKETFPRTWTSPGRRTAPGGGAEAGRGSLGAAGLMGRGLPSGSDTTRNPLHVCYCSSY